LEASVLRFLDSSTLKYPVEVTYTREFDTLGELSCVVSDPMPLGLESILLLTMLPR
jgi:hypothetical protein